MAYKISDACVCCGACEAQCPVGAISMGDGKSKSTQTSASTAVLAQVHVLQVLSTRLN